MSNRANLGAVSGVTLAGLRVHELAAALRAAYTTPQDPAEIARKVAARSWSHAFDEAVGFILGGTDSGMRHPDGMAGSTTMPTENSALQGGPS